MDCGGVGAGPRGAFSARRQPPGRVQNPSNRRENIVLLSNKGRNAYDQAVGILRQVEEELLAALTEEERE